MHECCFAGMPSEISDAVAAAIPEDALMETKEEEPVVADPEGVSAVSISVLWHFSS